MIFLEKIFLRPLGISANIKSNILLILTRSLSPGFLARLIYDLTISYLSLRYLVKPKNIVAELLGSMEARLKNTGLSRKM
jgi:hypothetical protein